MEVSDSDEHRRQRDEVFARLYTDHAQQVRALACRRAGPGLAEDVVQETFLRAYRAYDRYVDEGRPAAWLRRIAEHVCVDLHRRSTTEGAALEVVGLEGPPPLEVGDETFALAVALQQRGAVAAVLAGLHPRHRRVLVLREFDGWSNEEIARQLGMTIEGVKATLKRARSAFRAAYAVEASRQGGVGAVLGALSAVRRFLRRLAAPLAEAPPLAQAAVATVAAAVALVIAASGGPDGAAGASAPDRPAPAPSPAAASRPDEPVAAPAGAAAHAPRHQAPEPAPAEPPAAAAEPPPAPAPPEPGLGELLPIGDPPDVAGEHPWCRPMPGRTGTMICLPYGVNPQLLNTLK